MVLSPSHVKTTSPWASFHTQPLVGPCLPTPCPTWAPMVARLAHAEKPTGFWENDPLQPMPGWSLEPPPPTPRAVSISGFLALRGGTLETASRFSASPVGPEAGTWPLHVICFCRVL